ncbi:diguanylate cyclase [Conexibacter sp. JD483]|uniref:diguanylate cyclase n=1 Tax=unclassified Conexibacter TaxID=2627773 RepID=UPI0027277685|nr:MULTISPECIES: diguanylate cyclase [unclassified Conexibacter]MDO8185111.1 diguanylate cyclase [Conexibacter sp. CPCC 205706]MDO8196821.1 diguanylate cyclase [Conexibacter sp. CPCC 205762]MDR9368597.1 diguanylate cyclase [Conexibacter sp. JD483]
MPATAPNEPERLRAHGVRAALIAGALALAVLVAAVVVELPSTPRIVVAVVAGLVALSALWVLVRALGSLRVAQAQLARREADALRMADLDELTGLGNYRMFTRQLAAEVARSRRHDDPFSLVLLDLDGFKAINDELGHLAGDDALRHVAAALRETLREEDVCCRQGGDEFAVVAVRAGAVEAADLSRRLTEAIEHIPFGVNGERRLGACAGWATFGEPARSADELILRADAALREAKRARGSDRPPRQRPATSESRRQAGRLGRGETARLALLSGLARALAGARDEHTLAETTVAFLTGAFDSIGSAALATWPHAAGDEISAATVEPRLIVLGSGGEADANGRALAGRSSVRRALAAAGPAVVEEERGSRWIDGALVRSELAVAVPDGTGVWGCLLIACDRPRAYGIVERALAEAIAQQLGRALACRRLLDKLSVSGFGELYRIAADADAEVGGSAVAGEESDDAEQWRLADLAWQLGRALDLADDERRQLYLAALFHNVGTVGVPAALLAHPGELHDEERAILREHPLIGERMLRALPLLRDAAPIVRHEHERWDGGGYPDGLAGVEIPLESRILLACDVYVAMTSPRPWRSPRTPAAARGELRRVAGAQLDPRVVDALLELLEEPLTDRDDDDERSPAPAGV